MSVENVREHLARVGVEGRMQLFTESSATVELAAAVLGVIPARIAKTLSFRTPDGAMLVVAAGDAKVDNKKFREKFGFKAKMLSPDEVFELTGHPVGGVCPFAVNDGVEVYLDSSLQRFATVFPAVGSPSSAIELTCPELFTCSLAREWVDVCKLPPEEKETEIN